MPSGIDYPEQGPPVLDRQTLIEIARSWRGRRRRWRPTRGRTTLTPQTARRVDLYLGIVGARRDNPAFAVIDKERIVNAIQNLPAMNLSLAKQVHGAMATVIWLGGLEAAGLPAEATTHIHGRLRRAS